MAPCHITTNRMANSPKYPARHEMASGIRGDRGNRRSWSAGRRDILIRGNEALSALDRVNGERRKRNVSVTRAGGVICWHLWRWPIGEAKNRNIRQAAVSAAIIVRQACLRRSIIILASKPSKSAWARALKLAVKAINLYHQYTENGIIISMMLMRRLKGQANEMKSNGINRVKEISMLIETKAFVAWPR